MVLSILMGTGSLAWGYSAAGLDGPVRWFLAVGALWLVAQWRRWHWAASLIMLVFVGAAAYGLWIGLPANLMLLGAVGGLLGWDMDDFMRRLHMASAHDDVRSMELHHLGRVAVVAAISLGIAGFTTLFRVKIPFELAVVLVLLAAFGLTRMIGRLQRNRE